MPKGSDIKPSLHTDPHTPEPGQSFPVPPEKKPKKVKRSRFSMRSSSVPARADPIDDTSGTT